MRPSPSISPAQPGHRDVYLVLDDFGELLGRAWRETDEESADRHAIITDLADGQYRNPARVIAFNTAQGWSRDVSVELTNLILQRCAQDGFDVPLSLGFVDLHGTTRRHSCICRYGAWPCAAKNDVSNTNENVVWRSEELVCEGNTATPFHTAREFQ